MVVASASITTASPTLPLATATNHLYSHVPLVGFEPTTIGLKVRYSAIELQEQYLFKQRTGEQLLRGKDSNPH